MSAAGDSLAAESVSLTIRCAFQSSPDQSVEVPLSWTIKQLKEHLQTVHPSRPEVATQRIIYCGRCLTDECIIRSVFQDSQQVIDGTQVLHLVCPQPQSEIRQRVNVPTSPSQANLPTYDSAAHMQNWSHAYAGNNTDYAEYYRNYMNYYQQYQAHLASMGMSGTVFPHAVFVQNGNTFLPYTGNGAHAAVNLTGGHGQPVQINQNVHPQQVQNVNAADRVGRVDAIFDMFFKLVRVFLIVCALIAYSSLERFLLVFVIIMVILFTQYRRRQLRRAADQAANAPVNNNNAGEQAARDLDASQAEQPVDNNQDVPPPVPEPSNVQIFASACYSFVTSFIASLVPDNVPVDIN